MSKNLVDALRPIDGPIFIPIDQEPLAYLYSFYRGAATATEDEAMAIHFQSLAGALEQRLPDNLVSELDIENAKLLSERRNGLRRLAYNLNQSIQGLPPDEEQQPGNT